MLNIPHCIDVVFHEEPTDVASYFGWPTNCSQGFLTNQGNSLQTVMSPLYMTASMNLIILSFTLDYGTIRLAQLHDKTHKNDKSSTKK